MSQRFWGGVLISSLILIGGSGYFVFNRIQEKSTTTISLVKSEVKEDVAPVSAIPVQKPEEKQIATFEQKPLEIKSPAVESKVNADGTRNHVFSYTSKTAKNVVIIGAFNKWTRKKMTRKGDEWTTTYKLKSGTYEYKFVVDGKRITDPQNKTMASNGNSVLSVKSSSGK